MTTIPHDASPRARKRAERVSAARAELMARLDRPIYAEALPATVDLRPTENLRRRMRVALLLAGLSFAVLLGSAWSDGLLDRAEDEPLGEYLGYLLELTLSGWMLVPGVFLAAAGVFHRLRERRPDWLRISLSPEEAMVEGPGGIQVTPAAEFTAVALRTRKRVLFDLHNSTYQRFGRRLRPRYSFVRNETLWWVELVHPDHELSVPVWASHAANAHSMGKHVARGFAERLHLPLEAPEQDTAAA